MQTKSLFRILVVALIFCSFLVSNTPAKASGDPITDYLGINDYPYNPDFGPVIEVISFFGLETLEISYNGSDYEQFFHLVPGSNFFQTYGWKKFRFVADEGKIIFTPIDNNSKYWDVSNENALVFEKHVFRAILPIIHN